MLPLHLRHHAAGRSRAVVQGSGHTGRRRRCHRLHTGHREAIKYLLGQGELLTGALLTYDALTMRFRKIPIGHNPHCAICGDDPIIHELIDYEQPVCESKVGKGSL